MHRVSKHCEAATILCQGCVGARVPSSGTLLGSRYKCVVHKMHCRAKCDLLCIVVKQLVTCSLIRIAF